jgi:hypothetical protein
MLLSESLITESLDKETLKYYKESIIYFYKAYKDRIGGSNIERDISHLGYTSDIEAIAEVAKSVYKLLEFENIKSPLNALGSIIKALTNNAADPRNDTAEREESIKKRQESDAYAKAKEQHAIDDRNENERKKDQYAATHHAGQSVRSNMKYDEPGYSDHRVQDRQVKDY